MLDIDRSARANSFYSLD